MFSEAELTALEAEVDMLDGRARTQALPPACFHVNRTRAGAQLKRTKMFFGARCEPPATLLARRLLHLPQTNRVLTASTASWGVPCRAVPRASVLRLLADLWTHEQLAGAASRVACGVRVDVPSPPTWMQVDSRAGR